jgi:predicted lipoprotein with Yx(FWY)xxD motif
MFLAAVIALMARRDGGMQWDFDGKAETQVMSARKRIDTQSTARGIQEHEA